MAKSFRMEFPESDVICWFRQGDAALHREDGPAMIHKDGNVEWALEDKKISFEEWCEKTNKPQEEITFLKLKYGI